MTLLTKDFLHLSNILRIRRSLLHQIKSKLKLTFQLWISSFYLCLHSERLNLHLQSFNKSNKTIILNVGCGSHIIEEAINLDLCPLSLPAISKVLFPGYSFMPFYPVSFFQNIKCLRDSADLIIFSHVLEHIPPHTVIDALKVLYTYLRPNGIIRITVPALEMYTSSDTHFPPQQGYFNRIISINSLVYNWSHMFMYNKELISSLLLESGFQLLEDSEPSYLSSSLYDPESRKQETIAILGFKASKS